MVVQAEGSAPIVVTGTCVTVAAAPVSAAGYQGSCVSGDEAGTRLVGAIDTGPVTTPSSKTYGAWVAVPAGTAYVTFTYGTEHAWQRPVSGVSYFTIAGATPPLGGEPVVLQAFGPEGALLGEARSHNWTDATGGWHWG